MPSAVHEFFYGVTPEIYNLNFLRDDIQQLNLIILLSSLFALFSQRHPLSFYFLGPYNANDNLAKWWFLDFIDLLVISMSVGINIFLLLARILTSIKLAHDTEER